VLERARFDNRDYLTASLAIIMTAGCRRDNCGSGLPGAWLRCKREQALQRQPELARVGAAPWSDGFSRLANRPELVFLAQPWGGRGI
jgi:hypothetical protein